MGGGTWYISLAPGTCGGGVLGRPCQIYPLQYLFVHNGSSLITILAGVLYYIIYIICTFIVA